MLCCRLPLQVSDPRDQDDGEDSGEDEEGLYEKVKKNEDETSSPKKSSEAAK